MCIVDLCSFLVEFFCVSGKFLETAWRAVHSRQAAHAIVRNLGSWKRNRLAGTLRAARRHLKFYHILGLTDEAPGGVDWTARRRGSDWLILGISGLWAELNRRGG